MHFWNDITNSGVRFAKNRSEAKIVVVINYIALVMFFGVCSLLITRYLAYSMDPDRRVISLGLLFLAPIFLNNIGYASFSSLYISWLPSIGITTVYILNLADKPRVFSSLYDSLFIYLLGVSSVPFLVTSTKRIYFFLLSIILPMLILFYCQEILDHFGVGIQVDGEQGLEFSKNKMRSIIAYIIISGSCFSLKWLLEKGYQQNEDLLSELADKNRIIKEKASAELEEASSKLAYVHEALEYNQVKLLENEQRLSMALAATSDAVWEWDVTTGKTFYSSRWYEMLGYEDQAFEMNFDNWKELCHPDDYQETVAKISAVMNNPESKGYNAEFRMLHKNGSWVWILGRGNVVKRDDNLQTMLFSGTNTDISERKDSEEALRASEEKYRTIFENIQDVIFQTDLSGTILEVSPSIIQYIGIERKDIIGSSIYNYYYDPEDRLVLLNSLMERTELRDYELRLKSGIFPLIYVSINIKLFYDSDGKPSHIEGIIRDINERKKKEQIEEELKEASQRLALATESAGMGIWEWHIGDGTLIWDEQMYKLFEVDSSYEHVRDWRHHVHPDDFPLLRDKVFDTIETQKELFTDFRIASASGKEKHIETIANLFRNPNKPPRMIGVCWDITDRKITEEQLLQSEANLHATINNTTFFVWSIDRNFKIIKLNKPFKKFLWENYEAEVTEGQFINEFIEDEIEEFSSAWLKNYIRALAGESFEISEVRGNRHFKYSLNPIIENAVISGVTTFAEETTELKAKESELFKADKQIGELKLMALRSAMNPHFIFNTLSSIQYYILKNDQLNAVNYLSTFSKLIRSILSNSVSNKIKLTDELEQIKNYVNLELLRFENKFDFILKVDEELDVENIEISSMLIQPYIENAILHGLYNKSDQGILKISLKEDGDSVLFEIEDNGIGRDAASKYKFNSSLGHRSLGTTLTEERLTLINLQNGVSHEIEDLFHEGKPAGTRVKIWVN